MHISENGAQDCSEISVEELCGREFDWFARDLDGNFALFSTAGSGMVPRPIAAFVEDYEDIRVPSTGNGGNPWAPLGRAGLTVYDSCDADGYEKKVDGNGKPKVDLLWNLSELPNLMTFNGRFSETKKIKNMSSFMVEAAESKRKMKP